MVSTVHVELGIVVAMVLSLALIAFTRYLNYHSEGKSSGLTKNVVRTLALVFVIPITAILAIEAIISPSAVTAILGAALGYVFAGFDA